MTNFRMGNVKSATASVAREIVAAAQRAGHDVHTVWGYNPDGSEHGTGRAIDLMVANSAAGKRAGDFIAKYVWTHRKRLRLRHVIWYQTIRSTVTYPGRIRRMSDRGNSTANHKDHPHVLLDSGSYRPLKAIGKAKSVTLAAKTRKKSTATIAREVIAGRWGNGPDRTRRLKAAGYNPSVIQAEVNKRLR